MAQNASKLLYNTLYSGRAWSHGPVVLYSYTARAYTAALYTIQPIHYTALYAPPLLVRARSMDRI